MGATTSDTAVTRRLLTPGDATAAFDLVAAADVAAVGFVDVTPDEIAAYVRSGDAEVHGWWDRERLVGYGYASRTEQSNQVEIDLYVHPDHDPALGPEVLRFLEARARELAAEAGHAEPCVGTGTYRQDTVTPGWLRAAGFDVRTTFTRMRIDLDGPVENPPSAVAVREVSDEPDLRVAHALEQAAFVDHYSHVPLSYDRWLRELTEQGPDHARVYLAELDGAPAGLLIGTRQFEDDEDAGYVRTLGVVAAARGHGVAKALLRDYFARSYAAGRAAVLLHVDVANVTGALRLYEAVGMRRVLEIDAWAKGQLSS